MIGKGATPSFFAIANYNYTLTGSRVMNEILEKLISDEKRKSEKRGRKEGKIEGANEEKLRIAKDMKASGLGFDFIARFTGLSEEAVAALQG